MPCSGRHPQRMHMCAGMLDPAQVREGAPAVGRGRPGSGRRPAERSAASYAAPSRSAPRSEGARRRLRGAARPAHAMRGRYGARCPARRARRCSCGAARCMPSAAWAASWGPSACTRPCWPSWQARRGAARAGPGASDRPPRSCIHLSGLLAAHAPSAPQRGGAHHAPQACLAGPRAARCVRAGQPRRRKRAPGWSRG